MGSSQRDEGVGKIPLPHHKKTASAIVPDSVRNNDL
ncbi:MAG: hypothetical protein ACI8RZ_000652, partial [Myxococcota bacterium]